MANGNEDLKEPMKNKLLENFLSSAEQVYCFYVLAVLFANPMLFGPFQQTYYAIYFLKVTLLVFIFSNRLLWLVFSFGLYTLLSFTYNLSQIGVGHIFGTHDRLFIFWSFLFLCLYRIFISPSPSLKSERILLTLLSSVFCGAGLSKLIHSGVDWASYENIQTILLFRGIISHNQLTLALSQMHWLCAAAGISILIFQLVSPLFCHYMPLFFSLCAILFLTFDSYFLDLKVFLICMLPTILTFIHMRFKAWRTAKTSHPYT